ncbi:hypothetical protein JCM6882_003774 [Rhodosporidiobolus microsporus]
MPRSPSPDRRDDRSHHSSSRRDSHRDDRDHERRRSRSPRRDDRRSSRRDEDDDRRRDRSRSRDRERDRERRRRDDRSRSRSRSRDRHRSSRRKRSPSVSSSGSESDGSRDRRHKSSRRRRSRSRSRDREREDKDDRRRRREEKKERKARREEKRNAKKGLATVDWGKHGILTEADLYQKGDEFHAWLIGERMINPETLPKSKEKEIFKAFMEDYNTGTLPHEKYYDLRKYELKMNAVRMGETVSKDDSYDFAKDVEAAKASHRRAAAPESESLLNRSQLEALRKVQAERIQREKMQRLGMDVSDSLGVRMETKL